MLRARVGQVFPGSIKGRLLFLLLVVLVPVLLVQASIYYRRFEARRALELQANLEIARAARVAFERYLQDVLNQEFAIGLALTQPQPWPPEQVGTFLAQNAQQQACGCGFNWVNPQGQVVASSSPESV